MGHVVDIYPIHTYKRKMTHNSCLKRKFEWDMWLVVIYIPVLWVYFGVDIALHKNPYKFIYLLFTYKRTCPNGLTLLLEKQS
jgi:Trk-type K+ transport system membrane component